MLIAGSSIGELALHYLNRHQILVVKVLSKFDLRRICRVVGASPLARLGAPTPDEMGQCDVVETVEIGGDRVTVFRQEKEATRTATVVVRGATTNQMDDVERAIDDGVNVVKGIIKDPRMVAGAGATELELAKRIADFGEKTPGLAQHAIKRFADALEVVPRTLAENAGLDATEILSKLYAAHAKNDDGVIGVDIEVSLPCRVVRSSVTDSFAPRRRTVERRMRARRVFTISSLRRVGRFVTEPTQPSQYSESTRSCSSSTSPSLVRELTSIPLGSMSRQAGGPAPPKQNPNWDED